MQGPYEITGNLLPSQAVSKNATFSIEKNPLRYQFQASEISPSNGSVVFPALLLPFENPGDAIVNFTLEYNDLQAHGIFLGHSQT